MDFPEPRPIDRLTHESLSRWTRAYQFAKNTRFSARQSLVIVVFAAGIASSFVWAATLRLQTLTQAAEGAQLSLSASDASVAVDGTFTVDVLINTNNNPVVAARARVLYDPAVFRLQGYSTADSVFTPNNACQYQNKPCQLVRQDTAAGVFDIVMGKPTPGVQTTGGLFVELTFRALRQASPSADNIRLEYAGGAYTESDVIANDGLGTDILNAVTNARVAVGGSGTGGSTGGGGSGTGGTTPPPPTTTPGSGSDTGGTTPPPPTTTPGDTGGTGGSGGDGGTNVPPPPPPPPIGGGTGGDTGGNTGGGTGGGDSGGSGGGPTVPPPPPPPVGGGTGTDGGTGGSIICSQFSYSPWSACQPSGIQLRTVVGSMPAGCAGGNPALSQSCTYDQGGSGTACTDFTYSPWSACQPDSSRVRTVLSTVPAACVGGAPLLTEACTYGEGDGGAGGTPVPAQGGIILVNQGGVLRVGGDKVALAVANTILSDSRTIEFKGQAPEIAGGKVEVLEKGKVIEDTTVKADGTWKLSFKVKGEKDLKDYDYTVRYLDASGNVVAQSATYTVRVDLEDPEIVHLPRLLSKKRGEIVWWLTDDNDAVDHYKYIFNNRTRNTKRSFFVIPSDTPRGLHSFRFRVYDKAGNEASRRVFIWVR